VFLAGGPVRPPDSIAFGSIVKRKISLSDKLQFVEINRFDDNATTNFSLSDNDTGRFTTRLTFDRIIFDLSPDRLTEPGESVFTGHTVRRPSKSEVP